MKPVPVAILWSALSFLLCMHVVATISVYIFDKHDSSYGSGGSLQIPGAIVVFMSFVVGVLSAIGFYFTNPSTLARPKMAGALIGCGASAYVTLYLIFVPRNLDNNRPLLFIALTVVVFLVVFVGARFGRAAAR